METLAGRARNREDVRAAFRYGSRAGTGVIGCATYGALWELARPSTSCIFGLSRDHGLCHTRYRKFDNPRPTSDGLPLTGKGFTTPSRLQRSLIQPSPSEIDRPWPIRLDRLRLARYKTHSLYLRVATPLLSPRHQWRPPASAGRRLPGSAHRRRLVIGASAHRCSASACSALHDSTSAGCP